MGIGVMELIGVFLLSFVAGAVMKDWGTERLRVIYAYIKESVKNREWWDAQYRKNLEDAYKQIKTLDYTLRMMDDARSALHERTNGLISRIKDQNEEITTLRVQLSESYQKLEHVITESRSEHNKTIGLLDEAKEENRVAQAKNMTLEGDIQYLRARVSQLAKLFVPSAPAFMPTKKKKFSFTKPLKRRKSQHA